MSINMCNPVFGLSVTSSCVSSEGFESTQLLDPNPFRNNSGFMAERFIKPPVEVTFTFPFRIEIKDIVIDPKVGNQVSNGFEIFTASFYNISEKSSSDQEQKEELFFQSIGRSVWKGPDAELYRFVNYRYRRRFEMLEEGTRGTWTMNRSESLLSLRHQFVKFLVDVSHLKIKITKVLGGAIPCIRRIEIHGQPSLSCMKSEIDHFFNSANSVKKPVECRVHGNNQSLINSCNVHNEEKKEEKVPESECPEEFLDPITCELMPMPIVLPSGHTIDQGTLDKHITGEATWGRAASDPFTGIVFTKTSKPVPNMLLKSRVDQFLLEAGKKYEYLPRTTAAFKSNQLTNRNVDAECSKEIGKDGKGTTEKKLKPQHRSAKSVPNRASSLFRSTKGSMKISVPSVQSCSGSVNKDLLNSVHSSMSSSNFMTISSNKKRTRNDSFHQECHNEHNQDLKLSTFNKKRQVLEPDSHEVTVNQSLTDALNETLAQYPSYSSKQHHQLSSVILPENNKHGKVSHGAVCINFKQCSDSTKDACNPVFLYLLPCQHVCCKPCLLNSSGEYNQPTERGQYRCTSCNATFDSVAVKRIHLKYEDEICNSTV